MRRSRDPWVKLRRSMTGELREAMRTATRFDHLLGEGQEPAQAMAALGLTSDDAQRIAGEIRAATRRAGISLGPDNRLGRTIAVLDEVGSEGGPE